MGLTGSNSGLLRAPGFIVSPVGKRERREKMGKKGRRGNGNRKGMKGGMREGRKKE